jgi:hypothetical protein
MVGHKPASPHPIGLGQGEGNKEPAPPRRERTITPAADDDPFGISNKIRGPALPEDNSITVPGGSTDDSPFGGVVVEIPTLPSDDYITPLPGDPTTSSPVDDDDPFGISNKIDAPTLPTAEK